MPDKNVKIYTIGHSNAELEKFVGLLQFYAISLLVDVRSEPVSKYATWFNKYALEKSLPAEGITYKFMGNLLGGRPDDQSAYTNTGDLDYDAVRERDYFRQGIEIVMELAAERGAALMCSEEDPLNCHRSLLIAPALESRGVDVVHIRHDGSIIRENELRPQMKLPLF